MKRLLMISNSSGGLYIFRKRLIDEFIRRGVEVIILTAFSSRVDLLKETGATVIETPFESRGLNPIYDMSLYRKYVSYVKEYKPDHIITYTIKPNIYGGLAAQKCDIPYSVNITGLGTAFQKPGIIQNVASLLYRKALKKAQNVFFENASDRDFFVSRGLAAPDQCVVLCGAGVDLEYFRLLPYPKNDLKVKFGFIGRIMKEKGVNELFAAAGRLIREGYPIELHIVGSFEEQYQGLMEEGQKEGWLIYHGYTEDVRPYLQEIHCGILPSYHEGMSNTNLECAASGRPLITSDIPGCREAVIDRETGYLCEARNDESLYRAMKRMVEMSSEEREKMGLAGRQHMENVFDKQKVVAETVKHILN